MTQATDQLRGVSLRDDPEPEPVEEPLSAEVAELVLLGEWAGQQLSPLRRTDRWRVRRAVRRGSAVSDPRLAAAAVAVALWQAKDAVTPLAIRQPWRLFVAPVLIGLSGLLSVLDTGDDVRQALGIVCLVFTGLSVGHFARALIPARRRAARADRAERLNRQLLTSPASTRGENGSAPDASPTTLDQPCPEKPDAS